VAQAWYVKKASSTESRAYLFMSLSLSQSLVRAGQAALPEKIATYPLAKAKVQFYFLKKEPDSLKKRK